MMYLRLLLGRSKLAVRKQKDKNVTPNPNDCKKIYKILF